jgi:hypothetical protein
MAKVYRVCVGGGKVYRVQAGSEASAERKVVEKIEGLRLAKIMARYPDLSEEEARKLVIGVTVEWSERWTAYEDGIMKP